MKISALDVARHKYVAAFIASIDWLPSLNPTH